MVGFVPHIRGSALLLDSCPSLVVAVFVVLLILRVRRVSHWPLPSRKCGWSVLCCEGFFVRFDTC